MPEGYEGAYGDGVEQGAGKKDGGIATPLWGSRAAPYSIQPNGGSSIKGGEPMGPFGSHKETLNQMMGVARDSMSAQPTIQGGISTPMDTSKAEMPGVTGSSGTGPTGGAKISSPFSSPWGDSVG